MNPFIFLFLSISEFNYTEITIFKKGSFPFQHIGDLTQHRSKLYLMGLMGPIFSDPDFSGPYFF